MNTTIELGFQILTFKVSAQGDVTACFMGNPIKDKKEAFLLAERLAIHTKAQVSLMHCGEQFVNFDAEGNEHYCFVPTA